jgi:tRNA (cmo5U34)-methyltransferase
VESHHAWVGNRALALTSQEFQLLFLLVRSQNLIIPHEKICDALWASSGVKELKRLGVAISNLREKLQGVSPYQLESVRSRGYGLVLGQPAEAKKTDDPAGMHEWHSPAYARGWINAQQDEGRRYLRQMVHLLPFDPDDEIRVLDIGAGYGATTKLLLDAFPRSFVVVHDYSEPMLQEARRRLAGVADHVSYARGDLLTEAWTDDVRGTFDAVISAIAIHNVRYSQRIRTIYREVYELLEDGGCFYNVDYVTPPGDLVARARRHAWLMDYRLRVRQETGRWEPLDGLVERADVPSVFKVFDANEDDPMMASPLANNLAWLQEAGFTQVECFWHDGLRALMGAFKSRR